MKTRLLRMLAKSFFRMMGKSAYCQDGLISIHNHDFVSNPAFQRAYERAIQAGGHDYNIHWRAHVALWAATSASKLAGDFVECGVNRGFLSSAILHHLDWNKMDRKFYLLDTFQGLDPRFVSEEEKALGVLEHNKHYLETGGYVSTVDSVRKNFSEWPNAIIIQGSIPETLPQVRSDAIAYLHLDLNCAPPEVAAIDYFWNRLVPHAFVLLDDYAYSGYEPSKRAMDSFAATKNVPIVSLPTGQGLLMKPPQ